MRVSIWEDFIDPPIDRVQGNRGPTFECLVKELRTLDQRDKPSNFLLVACAPQDLDDANVFA